MTILVQNKAFRDRCETLLCALFYVSLYNVFEVYPFPLGSRLDDESEDLSLRTGALATRTIFIFIRRSLNWLWFYFKSLPLPNWDIISAIVPHLFPGGLFPLYSFSAPSPLSASIPISPPPPELKEQNTLYVWKYLFVWHDLSKDDLSNPPQNWRLHSLWQCVLAFPSQRLLHRRTNLLCRIPRPIKKREACSFVYVCTCVCMCVCRSQEGAQLEL